MRPDGVALPNGDIAHDAEAMAIVADLERRLTGERTAPLCFLGAMVNTGKLYREPDLDLWFIEVTKTIGMSERPQYVELSRDEAADWLGANRYEWPYPVPDAARFRALIGDARSFARACREHANYEERNPTTDWTTIHRLLHGEAGRLNRSLGGQHGEPSLRRPAGWEPSVGLAVGQLALEFEKIIGDGVGAWGLRSPVDPSALIDLPEPGSTSPGVFGDLRYRPFSFDPTMLAHLGRMEEAIDALEAACRRQSVEPAPPMQPPLTPDPVDHEKSTTFAGLRRSVRDLIAYAEFHGERDPQTFDAVSPILVWCAVADIENQLSCFPAPFQPYPLQMAALSRLTAIIRKLPHRDQRTHPDSDAHADRLAGPDCLKALRSIEANLEGPTSFSPPDPIEPPPRPEPAPSSDEVPSSPPVIASVGSRPQIEAGRKASPPSPIAFQAYQLCYSMGEKQIRIAALLSREHGRTIDQGSVSRMIKQVREWKGEVRPRRTTKTFTVDPSKLEVGERPKNARRNLK